MPVGQKTTRKLMGGHGPAFDFPGPSRHLIVSGKDPFTSWTASPGLQTVLGTDRRVRVQATDAAPWRMICRLQIRFPRNHSVFGTGWCAGRNLVMTAAHCVYNPEYGGWAEKVEVVPGCDAGPPPFGTTSAEALYVLDEWHTDPNPQRFDIGAVRTTRPLGDELGWFAIAALPDEVLSNQRVNMSGYPTDKPGGRQWFMANRIGSVDANTLRYDLDTYGGQSGSPIWIQDPVVDAEPVAVGLHAYGAGPVGSHPQLNSGPRFRDGIIDQIAVWIDESERAIPRKTE